MKKGFKFSKEITKICIDCNSNFISFSEKSIRCSVCNPKAEYKNNMLNYEWRIKKLYSMAKNRALKRKLPFNLSKEYLIDLWELQDGKCAISNTIFDLSDYGKFGQVNPNAPSIDRILPELGYIIGNVRITTYHVNVALSEFGLDALIELAIKIADRK